MLPDPKVDALIPRFQSYGLNKVDLRRDNLVLGDGRRRSLAGRRRPA